MGGAAVKEPNKDTGAAEVDGAAVDGTLPKSEEPPAGGLEEELPRFPKSDIASGLPREFSRCPGASQIGRAEG